MLALTGCSGKLGGATLAAILKHDLIPPNELVICTASSIDSPHWDTLKAKGITIRILDFDSPSPSAFAGCDRLFLISSTAIRLDFNNAPPGTGREKHHIAAIDAAKEAGVKHVFYTSLAFGSDSSAGVMQAHLRTEAHLKQSAKDGMKYTIMREGLYNESWPLYLGYFNPRGDERGEVLLAGDGQISWTAIEDLGTGSALVLADESGKYHGKTFYLSNTNDATSLREVAMLVTEVRGKIVVTKVVGRDEYIECYVRRGVERPSAEWWSSTYAALEKGECLIQDKTLEDLLASKRIKPKLMEETVREMSDARKEGDTVDYGRR